MSDRSMWTTRSCKMHLANGINFAIASLNGGKVMELPADPGAAGSRRRRGHAQHHHGHHGPVQDPTIGEHLIDMAHAQMTSSTSEVC